ncbi:hypothetical protein HPP92_008036 [Vanilla planifolia]|uniref:Uncharacterized protein n=1 Tax=Vanilla planifolia TaxID=51239 RepID=A0A835RJ94_VANPL|nr:hypothetical protein HPP92_008036 [Vanilla planifolia]
MVEEGNSNVEKRMESSGEVDEVRKGPWTMEEDLILINYIANHGEGVWNNLARSAGLKRTGKSCRLRWLNYLRPDVRRGNITPEEQFLIMDLHARWGNRWSKIARQLPGRTDNEIKNYWRTRIQKKGTKSCESTENPTQMIIDRRQPGPGPSPIISSPQPGLPIHPDLTDAYFPPNDSFWTVEDFWSMQPFN